MSSHQSSNENLSSYFDHEVSPEERKKLESLLERSAEARQELHEIGEISRLLQETATEPAPPELAPSIRRRIEQETLLSKPVQPAVKPAPSVVRYRIAVAISACSSMAALVLFVLLMNSSYPPGIDLRSGPGIAFEPSESSTLKDESSMHLSELVHEEDSPSMEFRNLDNNKKTAALSASAPLSSLDAQNGVSENRKSDEFAMRDSSAPSGSSAPSAPIAGKKHAKFSVRNTVADQALARDRTSKLTDSNSRIGGFPSNIPLDTVQIGDVLPYFQNIDDKVAVIEVRVVDVQKALGELEILLARNNIPVDPQKQSEVERQIRTPSRQNKPQAEGSSLAFKTDEDDSELIAIYVEATDKELAAALQDFQKDLKRDQFVGLALQPAINASSLTKEVKELPQLLAYRSTQTKGHLAEESEAKKSSGNRVDSLLKGKVSSKMKSNANKSIAAKSIMDRSKKDQIVAKPQSKSSFQTLYRMQVPARQLNQPQTLKQANDKLRSVRKKDSKANMPLVASKPAVSIGKSAQGRRTLSTSAQLKEAKSPIKVFFVFKNSTAAPRSSPPKQ